MTTEQLQQFLSAQNNPRQHNLSYIYRHDVSHEASKTHNEGQHESSDPGHPKSKTLMYADQKSEKIRPITHNRYHDVGLHVPPTDKADYHEQVKNLQHKFNSKELLQNLRVQECFEEWFNA